MKILVTGHKGYLGSYLFEALRADKGWDLQDGYKDINELEPGWVDYKADVVINCAAELTDNRKMIHTNVDGLNSVIQYCQLKQAKLIHFSSVSIYGSSFYGLTKRMGEELINFHNPDKWCILRMTNIYSPQGKGDSPACRFSRGEREIYGDGTHTKDHVHLKDVLQAVTLALKNDWTGDINLSSGKSATMNEIFARVGQGKAVYLKDKQPDLEHSELDSSKALKLGWEPTWNIFQENRTKNLYKRK